MTKVRLATLAAFVALAVAPERDASADAPAVRLVVHKAARTLVVVKAGAPPRSVHVSLGPKPTGPKRARGDGRTPEGRYVVTHKNPKSRFHLSLGLSYPNADDARVGLASGRISRAEHDAILAALARNQIPPQDTALGGDIFVHGGGTQGDWTLGCVAIDDATMDDLFASVPAGTPVTIEP
ncbi:MAG: L,D-transpeptidase family protein [Myxococcales bacterium]|nr:L,D-transpeptidase family protein [Myxococcales bacterium]MBL0197560.1 L,D-transpeptidase family protein [Myxococcales bacterium]HQY60404.1 L,D-transpeptidase family protein [Polyangiaceae bacterium]